MHWTDTCATLIVVHVQARLASSIDTSNSLLMRSVAALRALIDFRTRICVEFGSASELLSPGLPSNALRLCTISWSRLFPCASSALARANLDEVLVNETMGVELCRPAFDYFFVLRLVRIE